MTGGSWLGWWTGQKDDSVIESEKLPETDNHAI